MPKPEKVKTMEEFASLSGISRPTLSKFFNDPNSVRESTRDRIGAALERFEYTPNFYAINQNRQLTRNIGIVVPYLADPFFAEIARQLESRCIAAGYSPTLLSPYGNPEVEAEIFDTLRSMRPAGVLLAPLGRASNRSLVEKFCNDVPTVLFDSRIDGVGEAFVGSDNFSFVSQSVDYLMRSGEPPFFFEMRTPANPNAQKRRAAYIQKMQDYGIEPMLVQVDGEGWNFEEIGRRGALRLIEARELPTNTALCSNDRLAIGFLAACYESGLRVGKERGSALRVASNDDHPFSRYTCPALTTVGHDYDSVADKSVHTLIDIIKSGTRRAEREATLYPAKLILRDSA